MEGTALAQFRRQVESALKERAWSRRTLAAKAGLNPGTVSKFLRGVGPRPEAQTVISISRALGLSFNGAPAPAREPPERASTHSQARGDYASGYKDGWRDGWDAAVRVLHGGSSDATPSPP